MTALWRRDLTMKGGELMNKYIIKIRTFDDRQLVFNIVAANLNRAFEQVMRKMFAKGFRSCDFEFDDFDVKREQKGCTDMSTRITQKDIESLIKWINSHSKNQYGIDRAYGGYMLIQYVNENGGCCEVSPRVEGRQIYNILCSLQNYIIQEAELCQT